MPDALYDKDGERLVPSLWTRGPWDPGLQHGGPPAALLTTAIVRHPAAQGFALARISVDFLGGVPVAPVTVSVSVDHVGRTAARLTATLAADRPVMRAQGLLLRTTPTGPASAAPDPWPDPSACAPFTFPFFRWEDGYHRAIALRPLPGERWGGPAMRLWARPVIPLVAGEDTEPEARVMLLADAESGTAPPLDPTRYSYANPDLTVAFARRPAPGWLGFSAHSIAGGAGAGLSEAAIRDALGPLARSVQTLVVRPVG